MSDTLNLISLLDTDIAYAPEYAVYLTENVLPELKGVRYVITKARCDENMNINGEWLVSLGEEGTLMITAESPDRDTEMVLRMLSLETACRTKRQKAEELAFKLEEAEKNSIESIKNTQAVLFRQEKLASIGQLAAGIAHELNNPIGFISGNFEVLKSYNASLSEFMAKTAELIAPDKKEEYAALGQRLKTDFILNDTRDIFTESSEGFKRISGIVDNLLSFARRDTEKIKKGNLNHSILTTAAIARSEFKFVAELKTELGDLPDFDFNPGEMNQVLLNLILNASQAIKKQQRSDMGRIYIKTWAEDGYICCSVTDDGPGIDKKNLEKVFDPFYTTKPAGEGTGLGLSITHDIIVNKHGGGIDVSSTPGKTVFTFRLPEIRA